MTNDLNLYSSLMQVMAERYSCRDYDTLRAPAATLLMPCSMPPALPPRPATASPGDSW